MSTTQPKRPRVRRSGVQLLASKVAKLPLDEMAAFAAELLVTYPRAAAEIHTLTQPLVNEEDIRLKTLEHWKAMVACRHPTFSLGRFRDLPGQTLIPGVADPEPPEPAPTLAEPEPDYDEVSG